MTDQDAIIGRTTWSRHFTNWYAFVRYVYGCLTGERTRYPDWFDENEWNQAVAVITSGRYRSSGIDPEKIP